MNHFYVYAYLDPRKPGFFKYDSLELDHEPFYIGKGQKERLFDHISESIGNRKTIRNSRKHNKIKKIFENGLQPIIIKIHDKISEEECLILEKKFINLIGRQDLDKGPLTNHTDGGEGTSGYIFTEQDKIKMSEAQKKTINHSTRGKKFSEETKEKLRKGKIGEKNPNFNKPSLKKNKSLEELFGEEKAKEIKIKQKNSHLNKKASKSTRDKMSKSRMGHSVSKNVIKYLNERTGDKNPMSKKWIITNDTGNKFELIGGLEVFCKNNNLPYDTFKRIVNNKRKSKFWNGWTIEK